MASASKLDLWTRALDRIGETKPLEDESDPRPAGRVCRQHYDDILGEVFEAVQWTWARKQMPIALIDEQVASTAYADAVSPYTAFEIPYSYLDSEQVVVDIDDTDLVEDTDYTITPANPQTAALAQIALVTPLAIGETITITVTTERVGWEHLYSLPADCVTALGLLSEGQRLDEILPDDRVPFDVMSNDAGDARLLCSDELVGDGFDVLEYVAAITYVPMMSRTFVEAVVCRLEEELWRAIPKDTVKAERAHARFLQAISAENARALNSRANTKPLTPSLAARR